MKGTQTKTNLPLISVIIPVYNVKDYVYRCVRSVIAQSYRNLEILIIDDGSTDGSGKLCDHLCGEDNRIRVLHTENGGLSAARNVGLKEAQGSLIGFVDSDDWIEPDMYSFLYEQMSRYDADIAICSNYVDCGEKVKCKYKSDKVQVMSREEALTLLLRDKKLHNYAWDKLYRRELFDGISYPEGILYEDIATTYRLFDRCKTIVQLALPKYHYIVRQGSIVSGRYSIKRNMGYFGAMYGFHVWMIEQGFDEAKAHLVRRSIHSIKRLIISGADDRTIQDILDRIAPYDEVGAKQIGWVNVWRRYMLKNHLQEYKKMYVFSKKIFR